MFPETYGRTLEELAFLFEDHALADEATTHVEKQMEWAERRRSRLDERMSWEMDIVIPDKAHNGRDGGLADASTLDAREIIQRHDMRRRTGSWDDLRQRAW
jgi:hypothetical protein